MREDIEEAKQEAFMKGVRHGTTIRNLNWNTENHQRHGRKMAKAKEEAKAQERERIYAMIRHRGVRAFLNEMNTPPEFPKQSMEELKQALKEEVK